MIRKYISASAITVVSSVLSKAIVFLQVAVLTRLTTTEEYGQFSLFLSYVGIATLIIGGSVSSSFGIAKRDFGRAYESYISTTLGFSYLLVSVALLLYCFFCPSHSKLFWFFVIFHSFNLNILTNYDVKNSFDFAYKKAAIVSLSSALLGFIACTVAVIVSDGNNKGSAAIVGIILSTTAVSLFCQLRLFQTGKKLYEKKYWEYAIRNSFILIPHNLSLVILNQIDRIMIGELLSKTFVAIYAAVYSLSVVISILWTAIKKVWATWAYEKLKRRDIDKVREVNTLLLLSMLIFIFNYCFITPEIIRVFLPKDYWEGTTIMAPILFGYFFSFLFSIFVNIEYFNGRKNLIVYGTVLSALVNIVSNYYLLPIYGYKISAYTTLLSYFILFFYHYSINAKNSYFSNVALWTTVAGLSLLLYIFQILIDNIIARYTMLILFDVFVLCILLRLARKKNLSILKIAKKQFRR